MSDFSFVVGVTGHRDLAPGSLDATRDVVKATLESLRGQLGRAELQVDCGMASGADQLVAEVAIELGIPVHAVLPMPRSMYEDDFTGEAKLTLARLLESPEVTLHELPLPPGMDPQKAAKQGPDRDRLYARLGDYLVRRANLLLALWDGKINGLEGGTGDVLLRYLDASPADAPFNGNLEVLPGEGALRAESNLAIWIHVDRGEEQTLLAGEVSYLAGGVGLGRVHGYASMPSSIEERLTALSGHLTEYQELQEAKKVGPGWTLLGSVDTDTLPAELVSRLRRIDEAYLRVDGMALYNQKRSDRTFAIF